jgi:hypothetical protein
LRAKSSIGAETGGYTFASVPSHYLEVIALCHGATNWSFTDHKCE